MEHDGEETPEGFQGVLSRFISWKRFIRLGEKGYPDEAAELRRTRECFRERRELRVQPISACGRIITSGTAISGTCSICKLIECDTPGHWSLCTECKRSLCVVHTYPVQVVAQETRILPFCLDCCRQVLLNHDSWRFPMLPMRAGYEQRRLENAPERE